MGKGLANHPGRISDRLPGRKDQMREELAEAAKTAGVKVMTAGKGDELPCGKVSFSVLWPEKNATGKDVNEEAMVMELSFGDFQMLFYRRYRCRYGEKSFGQPGGLRMLTV